MSVLFHFHLYLYAYAFDGVVCIWQYTWLCMCFWFFNTQHRFSFYLRIYRMHWNILYLTYHNVPPTHVRMRTFLFRSISFFHSIPVSLSLSPYPYMGFWYVVVISLCVKAQQPYLCVWVCVCGKRFARLNSGTLCGNKWLCSCCQFFNRFLLICSKKLWQSATLVLRAQFKRLG